MTIPIVLCFSGHDPSGGAGIQADILAIHALHGHCASIITALTEQNTQNVFHFLPTPPELLLQQAHAIAEDMPIHAIKIGMIGSVANVKVISKWLSEHPHIPVVLDPVNIASGGGALGDQSLIEAIAHYLLPRATIVTPNAIEAQQFVPHAKNLAECAAFFLEHGCQFVCIKGAHLNAPQVTNTLYDASGIISTTSWERLPHAYHGSGCTLAASIAAFLAHGFTPPVAVEKAQAYTWQCLAQAYQPGKGQFVPQRNINQSL